MDDGGAEGNREDTRAIISWTDIGGEWSDKTRKIASRTIPGLFFREVLMRIS